MHDRMHAKAILLWAISLCVLVMLQQVMCTHDAEKLAISVLEICQDS
jgi:hypothetical protein